jgi:hypothetical protein
MALAFGKANPWEWLGDGQVFGLVHPKTGEKGYCSVMGKRGDFHAFAVYPGRQGWGSYQRLNQDKATADEIVHLQRCLMVVFLTPEQADADDLALLRHAGWKMEGVPLVPSFRSYLPGYLPWAPDAEECEWLLLALDQANFMLAVTIENPLYVPENGLLPDGKMVFRKHQADDWMTVQLLPDVATEFSPAQVALTEDLRRQGKRVPQQEAMWLLEEFYLPEPSDDAEGGRPYFPRALFFFDLQDQSFRGLSLLHPTEWPDEIGETLIALFEKAGHRPTQIVVSNRNNYILVKGFRKSLGIDLHLEEGLDLLPDLKAALLEGWGKG